MFKLFLFLTVLTLLNVVLATTETLVQPFSQCDNVLMVEDVCLCDTRSCFADESDIGMYVTSCNGDMSSVSGLPVEVSNDGSGQVMVSLYDTSGSVAAVVVVSSGSGAVNGADSVALVSDELLCSDDNLDICVSLPSDNPVIKYSTQSNGNHLLEVFLSDANSYSLADITIEVSIKSSDELIKKELYRMPFHFSYGGIKKKLIQSDEEILAEFDNQFGPNNYPTMLTPVLLNVDPSKHDTFIRDLMTRVPNLMFGIGYGNGVSNPTEFPRDWDSFFDKAAKMLKYSKFIRIEVFDNILHLSGEEYMDAMLNELHEMGFERIMLNPEKDRPSDATIPWPFVDSGFIGTGKSKTVTPVNKISKLHRYHPSAVAIINYENSGQHKLLTAAELESEGKSIEMMTAVYERQKMKDMLGEEDSEVDEFKWCPPWSHNYDPIALDTMDWIAEKMIEINGKEVSKESYVKVMVSNCFIDNVCGMCHY